MATRPSAATLNDPDLPAVPVSGDRDRRGSAGSRSPVGSTSSSRRHRDRSPPRRRDSRDYSPRDRDRRSRDSPRRRDYDDRDRDRRDRDRDYDRDRRPRTRSRSPPRRRHYDDDDRGSRRRDDRDYDRRRSPSPRRRRDSPAYNPIEKAQALAAEPRRSPTPELNEEEHEMRSVFVAQLAARVDDRALKAFFELRCGKVYEAKVITDRISRRSKGVGYVEFVDIESVPKALALTGTVLLGIPVFVQLTESEKNRRAAAANSSAVTTANVDIGPGSDARAEASIPYNRIYLGSLNFNLTDADIQQVFQPFGQVDFVEITRDPETNKSKGNGFVQFNKHADAKNALAKMQGFELLKTGLTSGGGPAVRSIRAAERSPPPRGRGDSSRQNFDRDRARDRADRLDRRDRVQANDLDDADYTSHISRLDLMQRLARTDIPVTTAPAPVHAQTFRVNVPTAKSEYLKLLNLFDAREETEPNWDKDLRDDVKAECEAKYGPVADIFLDRDSTEGEILIKFKSIDGADKALEGLNGRYFGGRQISAAFVSSVMFSATTGRK